MPVKPGHTAPIEPSAAVAEANRKAAEEADAADEKNGKDFADASRFQLAPPDVPVIVSRKDSEKVVWDFTSYAFLAPELRTEMPSVNGSLHRQGELTAVSGLFQVTSCPEYRVYQVRGYDLSNMTIVEYAQGLIIIDPLACYETAQAALKLFRDKTELTREQRPVKGLIYTHCHVDHFGGARGIFHEAGDPLEPGVPVVAPEGFLEHAVSENIYAGPAMARRAQFMYAAQLDKGPTGQCGSGLGLTVSTGEVTLVPPTVYIGGPDHQPVAKKDWNDSYVIPWRPELYAYEFEDSGFSIVFQLTPGTEAPAEMNIYLPDARTLCVAENATHTMHNILSLRGAQVRDAHAWSKYLTEAIQTFGEHTDVLFASHHWPMWAEVEHEEPGEKPSNRRILEFLNKQRDMYGYLNDQSLRLINSGYTGIEIAEQLKELPPGLGDHWYNRGYYGSMSHNLKAVYQRYMGWYDGNPAHLWELPPTTAGAAYVKAMGGVEAVVDTARQAYEGDTPDGFRWAAEILNHVIFGAAEEGVSYPEAQVTRAKELQAKVFTQLGYGRENATWRNAYLTGAQEVVNGPQPLITSQSSVDLIRSTTLEQYFSALARSVDGPTAAERHRTPIALDWVFLDAETGAETGDKCTTTLRNGVLVFVEGGDRFVKTPDATIRLSRKALDELAEKPGYKENFNQAVDDKKITLEGADAQAATDAVFGTLTLPDPKFPIVTPRVRS
ncbi:alkyl/aryl-sulfatase [Streptomyces spectabilis]|uniref:Alkyl sulfatase BDS1-like metallo-beta-lactamase superfamily hydrolase n=1 Tax=Streptomyces spectabilis TaxID=68270 RepID=A0A5P2X5N6_STRST|nr:alkyl sulfatase dimerization domain-containing protein [Streptomyces spectabilis]MBB5101081.1 alkyl sulfatase BDS1-like metallo-beta-lactamase superfamily hydrolase [Streptomyces spectabilis]MCI3900291.1 MBL fold metallo-hydrolase [Streptomyces spectabilis]QEV57886.1 MBL fold metallo-hydrolase [Streptomyces spectabilis]GGV09251.1 alkyl sulfatase [Streptomyces spectabilis]